MTSFVKVRFMRLRGQRTQVLDGSRWQQIDMAASETARAGFSKYGVETQGFARSPQGVSSETEGAADGKAKDHAFLRLYSRLWFLPVRL